MAIFQLVSDFSTERDTSGRVAQSMGINYASDSYKQIGYKLE
ncbi:hypothetical protein SAMN06297280_2059 [Arsukibacterium tuosuense]|uniref:Uncharacterized protein n=1 Tax=Arsukibacterium tuosuense TaxID=1323745 RepID=A0A285IWF9_9GAMM|nr:hypothetical protein SAMN06297280_2059 [Arsukibacterium tuosuense]